MIMNERGWIWVSEVICVKLKLVPVSKKLEETILVYMVAEMSVQHRGS